MHRNKNKLFIFGEYFCRWGCYRMLGLINWPILQEALKYDYVWLVNIGKIQTHIHLIPPPESDSRPLAGQWSWKTGSMWSSAFPIFVRALIARCHLPIELNDICKRRSWSDLNYIDLSLSHWQLSVLGILLCSRSVEFVMKVTSFWVNALPVSSPLSLSFALVPPGSCPFPNGSHTDTPLYPHRCRLIYLRVHRVSGSCLTFPACFCNCPFSKNILPGLIPT